jgi:hypothetical protein
MPHADPGSMSALSPEQLAVLRSKAADGRHASRPTLSGTTAFGFVSAIRSLRSTFR